MTISGFMMARNADKYYYPIRESILSILPIVDEFIVALGEGDPDDQTREMILSLNSPKIRVISRLWDEGAFTDARVLREETNFALLQCRGDWCFYLQADEVVHEADHAEILEQTTRYLEDPRVDGFLFNFRHFWGDYNHILNCHSWYQHDIRIIRNFDGIQSYKDAQSFRKADQRLNVIPLKARIFHYGYTRPPVLMQGKKKQQDSIHWGKQAAEEAYRERTGYFDYGPLGRLPLYRETHPAVMENLIRKFNWAGQLNYTRKPNHDRPPVKHEKIKYRLLSFIENRLLGGRRLWAYRNWRIIRG